MNWSLCLNEFEDLAATIPDFIISESITLFDTIAALEMMDEKMDFFSALKLKKEPILNQDNAISLLLHFLCGQSLTSCYYPSKNLYKIAQKLKTFGLYEEEEIISHDASVICLHGDLKSNTKVDTITEQLLSMLSLELPQTLKFNITPENVEDSIHYYLWSSRESNSKELTLTVETPALIDMMLTPPRKLHLIPNLMVNDAYTFIFSYYKDCFECMAKYNPIGLDLYWFNFFSTLSNSYFNGISSSICTRFNIKSDLQRDHVPLDVLHSLRHHLLIKDHKIGGHSFQDFLLYQFQAISKTIALHSKEDIQALHHCPDLIWPPKHLHDLLHQLFPGLNALFGDILHSNAHNPGRVRRLLNGFIESINQIPFHQYDGLMSKLLKDDNNITYLNNCVQLMTCHALFQWLLLGYSLELYENWDLLGYCLQLEYISKTFYKLLEKQAGLEVYQSVFLSFVAEKSTLPQFTKVTPIHREALLLKAHECYFNGFSRLMIQFEISDKAPFHLDLYKDSFYELRYKKQFRVLAIPMFPPALTYNHYQRKIASIKKDLEGKIMIKNLFLTCLKCIEDIKQDSPLNWDILSTSTFEDMLTCMEEGCRSNLKVLNEKKATLEKGRHVPYFK